MIRRSGDVGAGPTPCSHSRRTPAQRDILLSVPPSRAALSKGNIAANGCGASPPWRSAAPHAGRNGCGRGPDTSRTMGFEATDSSRARPRPPLPALPETAGVAGSTARGGGLRQRYFFSIGRRDTGARRRGSLCKH
eukprot:gene1962-biopygen1866